MNKAIKRIAMLFMVCGLAVSVSFGYGMFEKDEANYQKLKTEMEEVEQSGNWDRIGATCSWSEDGKVIINRGNESYLYGTRGESWCGLKNILAFVEEYRKFDEKELEKNLKRFDKNARVSGYDVFDEVRQMPRFKNDISIYIKNLSRLLEKALEDWKELKMQVKITEKFN